jgi:hypothetical protein
MLLTAGGLVLIVHWRKPLCAQNQVGVAGGFWVAEGNL